MSKGRRTTHAILRIGLSFELGLDLELRSLKMLLKMREAQNVNM